MVAVTVHIEHACAACLTERRQDDRVSTFADVDDALQDVPAGTGQVIGRRPDLRLHRASPTSQPRERHPEPCGSDALATGRCGLWRDSSRTNRNAAAASCYAPTLTLGGTAPHTVFDVVLEGVFQARPLHETLGAVVAGHFDTDPVAGEKYLRWQIPAPPLHHPGSFQLDLRSVTRRTLTFLYTPRALPRFPAGMWQVSVRVRGRRQHCLFYSTVPSVSRHTQGRKTLFARRPRLDCSRRGS
jgi:hypothetical protein